MKSMRIKYFPEIKEKKEKKDMLTGSNIAFEKMVCDHPLRAITIIGLFRKCRKCLKVLV